MSEGQNPADMVKGPGLGLLIVGILGICFGLFGVLSSMLGFGAAHMQEMQDQGQQMPEWSKYFMGGGPLSIVMGVIGIASSVFVAYGGLQMQKVHSRSVCMIAAILAMIPCLSPCCPLGLPIGIWALIVLNKPEVRAGFGSTTI
jgi:ABC-type glycerol-3-phosphate transport system permease component